LRSCEGHAKGGYGAYNDSLGNCTTGYGQFIHTGACSANDYSKFQNESQVQAEAQLEADFNRAAQWIGENAPGLSDGQQDATVDLAFNMGTAKLQTHDVWSSLMAGDLSQVPADITSLSKGGPGIIKRRAAEVNMFVNGVFPSFRDCRSREFVPIKAEGCRCKRRQA
jgi:GH24 family phage-related lysozyme (muramidase)